MANRYLIVADDFTGSNDTGVQMRRRGLETNVMFAGRPIPADDSSVVIDTESRGLTPQAAYEVVKNAVAGLDLSGFKYVIKKVDSTIRGNVAAEVKALDEVFGSQLVIFAPALPALDRTTVGGVHLLKGVPITQTELAKDPKKPVTEDRLAALLGTAYEEPVGSVSLEEIRSGSIHLDAYRVYACDSVTDEDLRSVIRAAVATGKKVLWVGAAAIADNIMEMESRTWPVLGVAASVSAVTCGQVKAAEAAGVVLVSVPIHEILSGKETGERYVSAAVESLRAGKDTILLSSSTYDRAELALSEAAGRALGMEPHQVSEYVQGLMGTMAGEILTQVSVSGVFITGGDTAMGVLRALKADGSAILSEITVGLPMMRLVGGERAGIKLVTKAGAFGKDDAVLLAFRKLKEK